jgi:hypothetical protein
VATIPKPRHTSGFAAKPDKDAQLFREGLVDLKIGIAGILDGFVGAASDILFWRKQGMTRTVFLKPEQTSSPMRQTLR